MSFLDDARSSGKRMPACMSRSSEGSRNRPLQSAITSIALPPCPTVEAGGPCQSRHPRRLTLLLPRLSPALRFVRSEEHTSELQSLAYLVCRLLLEKKKYRVISVYR